MRRRYRQLEIDVWVLENVFVWQIKQSAEL